MIPLAAIRSAAETIRDRVIRTPLIFSPALSEQFSADIYLKMENLQKTGSFKIRGATYKMMACRSAIAAKGVVAASAGNHAQGVALAARQAGVPATIVMPEWVSISKQEATRSYGGKVIIHGTSVSDALDRAKELADEGRTFVHPFDDAQIIAGQGTIGLEVLEDLPDASTVVVPVGGGGLIAGIASAVKAENAATRIVGVQPACCSSAIEARRHGRVVRIAATPSIADGISVKQVGDLTFSVIQSGVDDLVAVDEQDLASAMLLLLEGEKILAEGAGAAPLAALMNAAVRPSSGDRVVLVISGGNVDSPLLGRIISRGLVKNGRVMRIRVTLDDVPGALAGLLTAVARLKANVLHIYHDRRTRNVPLYVTHVELELETRGAAHVAQIVDTLRRRGYVLAVK
jgi:threonine dehydratase